MRPLPRVLLLTLILLLLLGAAPPVNQDYGVLSHEALEIYETSLHQLGFPGVQLHDGFVAGKLKNRMKGIATAFVRGSSYEKAQCWWIFRIQVRKFQIISVTRFPGTPPKVKWWI